MTDGGPRLTRVLLAEDQVLVRTALATLLDMEPDMAVVAQVGRGDCVLAAAREVRPDVAVVDIEMPGRDGLAVAADLAEELPGCRVVILTVFGRPGYLRRALAAGVGGFLLKDTPAAELAAVIRRVGAGERVVDPQLAVASLFAGDCPLSAREREVLAAARSGQSVAQLAAALHLSPGTVRNYLSLAMQKLGAGTRAEAARLAEEQGWL